MVYCWLFFCGFLFVNPTKTNQYEDFLDSHIEVTIKDNYPAQFVLLFTICSSLLIGVLRKKS